MVTKSGHESDLTDKHGLKSGDISALASKIPSKQIFGTLKISVVNSQLSM